MRTEPNQDPSPDNLTSPGIQGIPPPQHGMRLASAVLYVFDLRQSVEFYRDLLGLEVAVSAADAALLVSGEGSQLYVRSVGRHAPHATGGIGTPCLMWTAPNETALHRCERMLEARHAHISTHEDAGFTWVEGRDPSGIPLLVTYPGPEQVARTQIITRVYAW